jgi:putative intracellular protease/amidase
MEKKAYLLVFDGFADWEPALALCEINKAAPHKRRRYDVVTVGFSLDIVTSMGGLRVIPDIALNEVTPESVAIFILPGGDRWETVTEAALIDFLQQLNRDGAAVAAICGATIAFARAGLLRGIKHTSNAKSYLKALVPEYQDEALYVDQLAVADGSVITASGLGSVEFADEIIKALDIYDDATRKVWFDLFKHGVIPAGMA